MTRQDPVREPKQERSQKRVAQVLEAARSVIEAKGTASMKMSDVAGTAQVSIGSIYQYFPNKSAIVAALTKQILDTQNEKNLEIISETPRSLTHLANLCMDLLDAYFDLHVGDPVIRDIWAGYQSDKEIQAVDHDNDLENRDFIFEASKHLFREDAYESARRNLLILIKFGAAAVAQASKLDPEEAEKVIKETKVMLYASWEVSILPLGRASSSEAIREHLFQSA